MSDLIKREDAMGAVQDHFNANGFKGYDDGQKMMDRIKALPSAEAVQKWIPVSERLPKYRGTLCIVTIEGEDGARASLSYWQGNTHKWSDLGHYYKVIAWMPLPRPYREESE